MRAERNRRAAILTAEGTKQSAVLTAEGERQAAILAAEGEAQARILSANAEAQAIETVFNAVHASEPSPELLSYQYLQTLPEMAKSESNTMFVIPGEFGDALKSLSGAFGGESSGGDSSSRSLEEKERALEARAERLRRRREEEGRGGTSGKPGISTAIADLAHSARSSSVTDEDPHYVSSSELEEATRGATPGSRADRPVPGLEEDSAATLKRVSDTSPEIQPEPPQGPPVHGESYKPE